MANPEFIQRGAEGNDVLQIQRALQQLGFNVSDDGFFGKKTERAIIKFQRSKDLERFPITRGHSRQQRNSFRIPLV